MGCEVVALVAQHAHQLCGQCVVEQLHDGAAIGAGGWGNSTVVKIARGCLAQCRLIKLHLEVAVTCGL